MQKSTYIYLEPPVPSWLTSLKGVAAVEVLSFTPHSLTAHTIPCLPTLLLQYSSTVNSFHVWSPCVPLFLKPTLLYTLHNVILNHSQHPNPDRPVHSPLPLPFFLSLSIPLFLLCLLTASLQHCFHIPKHHILSSVFHHHVTCLPLLSQMLILLFFIPSVHIDTFHLSSSPSQMWRGCNIIMNRYL